MPNIGPLEIAVVLVIVLVIFGPKRLPELGKSMGKGIREFKGSLSMDEHDEAVKKPEIDSGSAEVVDGHVVTNTKA